MKDASFRFIACLLLACCLSACEDFIEKDLSNKSVMINSPINNYQSTSLLISFWWQDVDGAEKYNLIVVTPSFDTLQNIVIDTTITSNRFDFQMPYPGYFQWEVKAINNGSETEYTRQSLYIDSTLNLNNQQIQLLSPIDDAQSNLSSVTYSWSSLFSADSYEFMLINQLGGVIILDTSILSTNLIVNMSEGDFTWKVKAQNSNSSTLYSQRSITIDRTAPSIPSGLIPANGDTIAASSQLNWTHSPEASYDSIIIYSDSLQSVVFVSATSSSESYSFSGTSNRYYYWKLKSIDAAGNESNWTSLVKYFVQ